MVSNSYWFLYFVSNNLSEIVDQDSDYPCLFPTTCKPRIFEKKVDSVDLQLIVPKIIRNVLFYRRLNSYQRLCMVVFLNMITMFLKKHPYFHLFVDQDLEIFSKTELPRRLFVNLVKFIKTIFFSKGLLIKSSGWLLLKTPNRNYIWRICYQFFCVLINLFYCTHI